MDFLNVIVEWTKLKCRIQAAPQKELYFKEREICWASIGANIGSEQNGKHARFERPVLVLRKFSNEILWILPITTTERTGKYYFPTAHEPEHKQQIVALSQIRTISSKRLIKKQRTILESEFQEIRSKIRMLL
jgi:mRNA-degrading endonuclease toxin of MazEF toxin-antitoxin module